MVSIFALLLPIVLSAVLVFVVSSIIHMVFTYHRSDFSKVPSEGEVMDALRPFNIPPGNYVIPHSSGRKETESQEFKDKANNGPVAFMTVLPNGMPGMGRSLAEWFGYCIIVGIFAAYIAGRALEPGAEYLTVFRLAGAASFIGYSLALMQNSIWYKRSWSATLKSMFDGLIYSLVTAGAFGWLWP